MNTLQTFSWILLFIQAVTCSDSSIRLFNGSVIDDPSRFGWFRLDILHTSDVRGHIMPVNRFSSSCSMDDVLNDNSSCFGGVARAATYIESVRSQHPNSTLLVDTGNYFYGTLFFYKVCKANTKLNPFFSSFLPSLSLLNA